MARTGDTQARDQLEKLAQALPNLGDAFLKVVEELEDDSRDQYKGFLEVLRRDAASGHAAVQLVLAQQNITSQMVDNLNGMIHLRALLTMSF
ncbi:MAG: hypothetical protein Ct9H300mP25_10690 [Acidobacteriota bacterium]|nr:MAG: hypothetical protein Ct9H300mP25_10690 [Acidobacteriota bacterium]